MLHHPMLLRTTLMRNPLLLRPLATMTTAAATRPITSTATGSIKNSPPSWRNQQHPKGRHNNSLQKWMMLSTAATPTTAYHDVADFPSLVIGKDTVTPLGGSFAQVTATFLQPDPTAVDELVQLLRDTNTGIVAHYYMDVELQGILTAVADKLPGRIGIADSLKMGDMAVDMAADPSAVTSILCLGVDFMAESVQAILSRNGYAHVPVYRADARKIGCSLAESAESDNYRAWLQQQGGGPDRTALHVVYINTSLETKAVSSATVPTITCTSSNVLPTILQASAQMGPQLKILYGPDTYMGNNLERLLDVLSESWTDEQIQADLHPRHSRATLKALRDNLVVFPSGNCVVHHMFGHAVVDTVKEHYDDCYVTAHLEVPGEMFEIAMSKSLQDDGVVGSTSNILQFISRKVQERAEAGGAQGGRLRFILGTEAGMVTSIVQSVQTILKNAGVDNLEAEVIFPVASEAVTSTQDDNLAIVPGVQGGEGCSTAGGCATCPFMKMNHIDAVTDVLQLVQQGDEAKLARHLPPNRLQGKTINGVDAMDLGVEAILYMRQFMKDQTIPDELVQKIMAGRQNRELLYRS
eukprot:scaffold8005_cov275-Amphora_coffeaeformis.AAC.5